jgi:transposase
MNSGERPEVVPDREGLGRSRGGLTTKIHLVADSRCRPIARVTTAGQRHDSVAFTAVMADISIGRSCGGPPRTRPDRVLADKAYSSKKIRNALRGRGIKATIPEPSTQIAGRVGRGSRGGRPPKFDKEIYKKRNTVERAINRLRGYRAVATRYDKREFVYRGTIDVASIGIWLRKPADQDPRDTA